MEGRRPDFKSKNGGWVCWTGEDKNGNPYLNITVEGVGKTTLFKVHDKTETKKEEERE